MMDIRQLKYFVTIAKERNITKAAEKLHIAQPPLSKQLKLLEEELDIKLIERDTRNFQISHAGEILLNRSEQIIELLETTLKELKNLKDGFSGTLSIGTIPSSGVDLLPKRLYDFHEKYPGINFKIREGDTYKILELLTTGEIEIGLVRTPFDSEIYESIWLPDEPMVAVSNDNFYFDENKKYINLSQLSNKPLIIDRRFKKMIENSCKQNGFSPRIICESEDARSVLLWASSGLGVGIIPKPAISLISTPNLKYTEINESTLRTRTAVIWIRNQYLSDIARHFLNTFEV